MGNVSPVCCCCLVCHLPQHCFPPAISECSWQFLVDRNWFSWACWWAKQYDSISSMKIIVKTRVLSVCSMMQSMFSQCGLLLKICFVSLICYDLGPRTSGLVNEYVLCVVSAPGFMCLPFCLGYILPCSQEKWNMSGRLQSSRPSLS